MTKYMLMPVFLTCALVSGSALFGQEPEPAAPGHMDAAFHEMDVRDRQLDLEQREAEMAFDNETRKLKLEERRIELAHKRQQLEHGDRVRHFGRNSCKAVFGGLCLAIHILLAVWVFGDIRKRNSGSGIWIVVTLLAGFFGALLYAVVRLGDKRE